MKRNWIIRLLAGALVIVASHLLDPVAYEHFCDRRSTDPFSRIPDWRMSLRIFGYLPLWWVVALLLWLHRPAASQPPHWAAVAWLPLAGVLVAEIVKFCVRRRRPIDSLGDYEFIAWSGELTTSGMGFPSSHALVAFTGAFALTRALPRGRGIWILLAVGCALSRVACRHHFLSDVVTSGVLAAGIVVLLWPTKTPGHSDDVEAGLVRER